MAQTLTQTGISSGSIVQVGHVTQSIDAFTGTEAYDITLSGSLTVTGSMVLNTIINQEFYGTASFVQTSSYSPSGSITQHSLTTSIAGNESIDLQLFHPPIDLTNAYYIGLGDISTDMNVGGITYLKPTGEIRNISISTNVLGNASSDTSQATLIVNNTNYPLITPITYSTENQFVLFSNLETPIMLGDRIQLLITPNSTVSPPTQVVHTANIHIRTNV